MTSKSSTGTSKSLAGSYLSYKRVLTDVKRETTTAKENAEAGVFSRYQTLQYMTSLTSWVGELTALLAIASVADFNAYAQAQEADPTYDCVGDGSLTIIDIIAARDWIVAQYPQDASQFAKVFNIVDGKHSDPGFNPAALAGLVPFLNVVLARID